MSALAKIEQPTQGPSLEVFDRVPSGCIAFAVLDHSCMPLVQPGEVLVVEDEPRMYPIEGKWFLIQFISKPRHSWERDRVTQLVGIPRELKPDLWGYGPPNRRGPGTIYCGDFGFSYQQMADYIRGPVIGIYRPNSEIGRQS